MPTVEFAFDTASHNSRRNGVTLQGTGDQVLLGGLYGIVSGRNAEQEHGGHKQQRENATGSDQWPSRSHSVPGFECVENRLGVGEAVVGVQLQTTVDDVGQPPVDSWLPSVVGIPLLLGDQFAVDGQAIGQGSGSSEFSF